LVVPGLLRRKKRHGKKLSSAASTDQSSTTDHIFNPMANNDRQQLLVQSSNQLAADWYDDDDDDDVALSSHASSRQPAMVTPTSEQSSSPAALLSFPSPKDRSHHARRSMNKQEGVMHAYEGELEPEGVRGQEARITPTRDQNSNIPLRTFNGTPKPLLMPVEDDEEEEKEEIYSPRVNTSVHRVNTMRTQRAMSGEISTTSSQDIQSMMQTEFSTSSSHADPRGGYHRTSSSMMPVNYKNPKDPLSPHQSQPPQRLPAQFHPSQERAITPQTPSRGTPQDARFRKDESVSHASMSSDQEFKVPRQSAPVNVDDSQFEDPNSNVQGIHAMAMEHVVRGEYDMALQAFSQVLTVYIEKHGRGHPLTASAYHNLGTVHSKRAGLLLDHTLHQRHCREQALLCFQAAARSARDSPQLGTSHPNVAVSLVRIGFLLLQSRQYQNAVVTFQEALRIRQQHYGPTHALVANLYNNLGVCHMHLQEFVVGRRYLQQALDIQKDLLGNDQFSTTSLLELADTLCNIGGLCLEWIRQQGPDARHALDAESAFLEALEVRIKVLGDSHVLTNQVRSLHDMVRSIPLPKMSDKRPNSPGNSAMSPARSARGISFSSKSPPVSPYRPYATASTPPVSPSRPPVSPSSGSRTPEALNLPKLEKREQAKSQRRRADPPALDLHPDQASRPREFDTDSTVPVVPGHRSAHSELGSAFSSMISDAELSAYEATEENFVLDHPQNEDGQMTVISYAQSTTSLTSSAQRDTERLAYLMQAKAILDAHRDQDGSPQNNMNKQRAFRQEKSETEPDVSEDGLAPLGGVWPEATTDRITPEVLQYPHRHMKTIHNSAANFLKRGRYSESLHLLEIVVDVQRSRNGEVHADVGAALHNVGIAELRLGENYKALQAFEEAVRVRKGALGRDHPQVAVSLVKVGITLMLLKRLEDSLWIFREALTVRKYALGPLHPSTARIYNNIGCVHVEFNESKEAKSAFEAALDIQRKALDRDPNSGPILFGAATTLQNLAYLYRKNRLYEQEALVLRESLGVSLNAIGQIWCLFETFAH
jgi:tetratricopeptide (TPR) repeat protein